MDTLDTMNELDTTEKKNELDVIAKEVSKMKETQTERK